VNTHTTGSATQGANFAQFHISTPPPPRANAYAPTVLHQQIPAHAPVTSAVVYRNHVPRYRTSPSIHVPVAAPVRVPVPGHGAVSIPLHVPVPLVRPESNGHNYSRSIVSHSVSRSSNGASYARKHASYAIAAQANTHRPVAKQPNAQVHRHTPNITQTVPRPKAQDFRANIPSQAQQINYHHPQSDLKASHTHAPTDTSTSTQVAYLLRKANVLQTHKKYSDAVHVYNEVLVLAPRHTQALNFQGLCYVKRECFCCVVVVCCVCVGYSLFSLCFSLTSHGLLLRDIA